MEALVISRRSSDLRLSVAIEGDSGFAQEADGSKTLIGVIGKPRTGAGHEWSTGRHVLLPPGPSSPRRRNRGACVGIVSYRLSASGSNATVIGPPDGDKWTPEPLWSVSDGRIRHHRYLETDAGVSRVTSGAGAPDASIAAAASLLSEMALL